AARYHLVRRANHGERIRVTQAKYYDATGRVTGDILSEREKYRGRTAHIRAWQGILRASVTGRWIGGCGITIGGEGAQIGNKSAAGVRPQLRQFEKAIAIEQRLSSHG